MKRIIIRLDVNWNLGMYTKEALDEMISDYVQELAYDGTLDYEVKTLNLVEVDDD